MSYCRWSCDDFECDLYCYSDVSGGWTIHVAGNRHVGKAPSVASAFDQPFDGVRAAALFKAQSDWLEAAERVPIGLPHDGETFREPTIAAFRDRLISLRALGYRFPDYVLDGVDEEVAALASEARGVG